MKTLTGKHINLRALELADLTFLYTIENDESYWSVSNTQKPFSKFLLQQYLENAHQDIYQAKQLRLLIEESKTTNSVGLIDLFDYEPKHRRAGIGILISPNNENKGYASEALEILINYAFTHLDLHQIHANITEDNIKSIALFEKFGFKKIGLKKDWIFINGKFKNELLYQLIND
ncbi:GNAT family N-acetyltransferase [Urechidicola croceus]|uniref:GNAT family N-acetyltransferase n=1 Tax=Urechidicola croceus TaxID=1850246 RepID=A0A1D8P3R3_9FLAO|nr:GNAT family protein [Urechidicola croceus]AOW19171.1 GNAT family N-acetyltransferase [Urechidicola croceus]